MPPVTSPDIAAKKKLNPVQQAAAAATPTDAAVSPVAPISPDEVSPGTTILPTRAETKMTPAAVDALAPHIAPALEPAPDTSITGTNPSPSVESVTHPNLTPTLAPQGSSNPVLHAIQRATGIVGPQPQPGQPYTGPTTTGEKVNKLLALASGLGAGMAVAAGTPEQKQIAARTPELMLERQLIPAKRGLIAAQTDYNRNRLGVQEDIAAARNATQARNTDVRAGVAERGQDVTAGTKGFNVTEGPNGPVVSTADWMQKRENARNELVAAQTAAAKASADYNTNPNNPRLKQAHEEAMARLQQAWAIAQQNFGLRQQSLEIQREGMAMRGRGMDMRQGQAVMKVYDPAMKADERLRVMRDALMNPTAQNDVAMLFNHMGMTLSAQTGARMTNAEIARAIKTRTLPQSIMAEMQALGVPPSMLNSAADQYEANRYVAGGFLDPKQRQQMFDLGVTVRNGMWNKSRRNAAAAGLDIEPAPDESLPPVQDEQKSYEPVMRPGATAAPGRGVPAPINKATRPPGW